MKFAQEFIERVAEANNIVDLISPHTTLKATGSGLMGRCPFPDHVEKTASFSVSETKQVYHCFGCHKSGNIFSFLRDFQGLSFPEAIEFLADRAGIALPVDDSRSTEQDRANQKRKQLLQINKLAMTFFQEQLHKISPEHKVKKYIEKRGLGADTVETFSIGYAPPEWDALVLYLQSKGASLELAEEARLIKARTQGKTGYFDLFRDRLMFPILNFQGDVVAFGGRIIDVGEPKYLNSPETAVFFKGKTLYGLYQTARHIRSEDAVLVVEGYMDLVSLYQSGIRNVVATMGTAMTLDHARYLKRMTKNIVVLFDGDKAGIDAAERSLPLLLSADLYPKGLILPDKQDPDDFVKSHGAQELSARLQKAPDLFSLNLNEWFKDYRGEASDKVRLIDLLKEVFRIIPDPRLYDLYLVEAARKLSVDPRWLKQALVVDKKSLKTPEISNEKAPPIHRELGAKTSYVEGESAPAPRILLKDAPLVERKLLGLTLKSRANLESLRNENFIEKISHEGVRKVIEKAFDVYRQSPDKFDKLVSHLMTEVDEPRYLFSEEQESRFDFDEETETKFLRDTVKRVKENFFRDQLKKLAVELKLNPSSEKMEMIMNLQRELSSLK